MSVRTTLRSWPILSLIKARTPFHAGGNAYGVANMRGTDESGSTSSLPRGALVGDTARLFDEDRAAGNVEFVVWSYHTPIAWFGEDNGWVLPDEKYSSSTSRHQSRVRHAVL